MNILFTLKRYANRAFSNELMANQRAVRTENQTAAFINAHAEMRPFSTIRGYILYGDLIGNVSLFICYINVVLYVGMLLSFNSYFSCMFRFVSGCCLNIQYISIYVFV